MNWILILMWTMNGSIAMTTFPTVYNDRASCERTGMVWSGGNQDFSTDHKDYVCLPTVLPPILTPAPAAPTKTKAQRMKEAKAAKEAALKEGRPYGDPKKFDAEK